ncbi:MAG: thioredoxin family protein [Kiritimatiellae bacterium]|nr:thioredoxin family protein [Kiritimatiellia bacterium]
MKRIFYLAILIVIIGCGSASTSEQSASANATAVKEDAVVVTWLTNFEVAQKLAKEKKLPILVDFSGSDWCGWCIKLHNEVFSQNEFKKYAKDNLVLLFLDFPSKKEQSETEKKQNQALAQKYGVQGFPTVLLLDAEGKVIGRTGYQRGGPTAYVDHLKEFIKK